MTKWVCAETNHITEKKTLRQASKTFFRMFKCMVEITIYDKDEPDVLYYIKRNEVSFEKINHRQVKY